MVRLSLHMHIDGLCYIDEEEEEKFNNLWLPKWLFGCNKESPCSVFKLCSLIHSGIETMILCVGILAVIAGAFWVLHTCLNELNMSCCSLCGYYDPDNDNETDNDKENRNGKGKKRRMKDTQCRGCVKRRKGVRGCCPGARIHTMDHVCVDPQHSHSTPIRLLVRAEEVHIRPVQDPENLIPTKYEAEPREERRPRERRSRSRSPEASCSRVSMRTPNLYVVEDSPPRSPRAESGCKPATTAFSLRSAWDSSSEEEMEMEGRVPVRP